MCLITNQKEAITLTEDLIVYKNLLKSEENLWAIYQDFRYDKNKLYETEFSFNNNSPSYFDEPDSVYLDEHYTGWRFGDIMNLNLIGVECGFHAALTKERLSHINGITYKCLIPAGSEVYYNPTGLIVSNKIIIL